MKKVIIFGARGYGEYVQLSLDDMYYEVVAITDNNSKMIELEMMNGVHMILPSEIKNEEYDYVIIAYGMHEEDIRKQLVEEIHVDDSKIVTFKQEFADIKWLDLRVAMLRKCIQVIKERNVAGNMAELGVYRGDFAKYMNRYLPDRKLYLFDTFEGFSDKDHGEVISEQFQDTSADLVLKKMEHPENVIIKKGYFPETTEGVEEEFCFVSLDADLYMPILNGLKFFYPRMKKGGYIFIHDFDNTEWIGCKKAVLEFCEEYGLTYVPMLDKCNSIVLAI